MARTPRKLGGGLRVGINTDELIKTSNRLAKVEKVTKPLIASGLNDIGDELVVTIATGLAKQTGLGLEAIRGLLNVKPARANNLAYEVHIDPRLYEREAGRKLEGMRESSDFGRNEPGEMVIVVSQKDDLVCMDCLELEAAGPMPVEIAMQHLPKHPNCRCIIMPYARKGKRMEVTMTTVSGTDPRRRMGGKQVEADITLRQITQNILDKTSRAIRIQLER